MPIRHAASAEQLHQLLDAVVAVGSELDLPSVLRRIVEVATDLVGSRYGALGVLDEAGTGLAQFITVGLSDEEEARIGALPEGRGILGVLILEPQPLRLDDLSAHIDAYGFPPNHPVMRTFLGVPIAVRGKIFGNLYLCDKVEGTFTEVDEELAVALGVAAGAAIDNVRLHARVGEMARHEDRDRIARDLHDTVIQRLYAVGLSLQGAASRLTGQPEVEERVQVAIDEVDATIRDIRSTIFELTPYRERGGLKRQVLDLCADLASTLPAPPEVRFDGPVDTAVPPELGAQVAAVVREALSNVSRHAKAFTVSVEVSVAGEPLDLEVVVLDDGVGLPAGDRGDGLGLANLSSRAAEAGGELHLEPGPDGRGTRLRWRVPVGV